MEYSTSLVAIQKNVRLDIKGQQIQTRPSTYSIFHVNQSTNALEAYVSDINRAVSSKHLPVMSYHNWCSFGGA
jgi:hypothetical protein